MKATFEIEVKIALHLSPKEIECITSAIASGERRFALTEGEMWYKFLQTYELVKNVPDWLITVTKNDLNRIILKSLEQRKDEISDSLYEALFEYYKRAVSEQDILNKSEAVQ